VLLISVAEIAVYIYPPLILDALSVVGRSPFCSVLDAFQGGQKRGALERETLSIRRRSRMVMEDTAGFQLWETPLGRYWIPKGSESALPVLAAQQAVEIYTDDSASVRSGDVVLDCGAHVGLFTRQALRRGAGLVVAIEPSPRNLECLKRNLRKEIDSGRVIIYAGGVWDKRDRLTLFSYDYNTAADSFIIRTDAVTNTYQASLIAVDELVMDLNLARVDFVKMDIRGATAQALRGARRTLTRWKPRMAIATEQEPDNPEETIAFISELRLGYQKRCGVCVLRSGFNVFPAVLFFY
jgi:FkbM family methyltransferase